MENWIRHSNVKKLPKTKLPKRALTNFDLIKYAKALKIPYFRGVFMRDSLPKTGPWKNESAIVNLDSKESAGTHWCCYRKRNKETLYFDSFGNLSPPSDIMKYLGDGIIKYNHERFQKLSYNCGQLCLHFLINNST